MTELHFARPCTFTTPTGEVRQFAVGRHGDVPDEIANHWFVKEHLVKDSDAPAAPEAAPLTHEERIKVKAAIDAAEGRAKGAEAERDAAVARADALKSDLDAERKAHGETRALLDSATAPTGARGTAADGGGSVPHSAPHGPYTIARGHQGSFKVMKGEETIASGLSKVEAEAKLADLSEKPRG